MYRRAMNTRETTISREWPPAEPPTGEERFGTALSHRQFPEPERVGSTDGRRESRPVRRGPNHDEPAGLPIGDGVGSS